MTTKSFFILLKVRKIGIPIGVDVRKINTIIFMLSGLFWSITMKSMLIKAHGNLIKEFVFYICL